MNIKRLSLIPVVALALTGCATTSSPSSSTTTPASDTPSAAPVDTASAAPVDTASAPAGAKQCEYTLEGAPAKQVEPPSPTPPVTGSVTAKLTFADGPVTMTLDRATTPCTTNSFESLAKQGYFDATTCHRLTDQGIFVLQCGDPSGTGRGGPGYSFADELTGAETYPAGTVAMANGGPNTNGSQFFIVYKETALPPSYTVFGKIDQAGLDTVGKIAEQGEDGSNGPGDGKPNADTKIQSVTLG